MKKIRSLLAGFAVLTLFGSCADDFQNNNGEGSLSLTTTISDDMKGVITSRALSTEDETALKDGAIVWISKKDKGVVRKYKGLANVPESINLASGSYIAEVWAGDSVPASFTSKWFKAYVPFDVVKGQTTTVTAECKIANVAVAVKYPEGIEDLLSDISLTVFHPDDQLTFNGLDDAKNKVAYFMMSGSNKDLRYTLTGKQINDKVLNMSNTLRNVQSGFKYTLNIRYNPEGEDAGGVVFDVLVEEEPIGEEHNFEFIAAPIIQGYGFDLEDVQIVPQGKVGRKVVHISSAVSVVNAVITSELFVPFLDNDDVDITRVSDDVRNLMASHGFSFKYHDPNEALEDDNDGSSDQPFDGATLLHINFEASMLDALEEGEYSFEITATDENGKTSSRTLSLRVTNAAADVMPVEEAEITYDAITLRACVLKDDAEKIGFNWRKLGDTEWNYAEGVVDSRSYGAGTNFHVTLTGLEEFTSYEYQAVVDDYLDEVLMVATKSHTYLPNGGFEDWQNVYDAALKKNVLVPCAKSDGSDLFWDSGNHGSQKTSVNVTEYDESFVHSGKRSLKMESKFPSIIGIGKFAAGNIFIGKYLETDGTDGVLGWGRSWPSNERPKGLKGFVRYKPVPIDKAKPDKGYVEGEMDRGLIKIALVNNDVSYGTEHYGFIVKTKSETLFQDDASYVVALGKKVLTEDTGDGWLEFDIPLEDVHPGTFNRIVIVASSSMGGDYFAGGVGSTMWLDDIQVYY